MKLHWTRERVAFEAGLREYNANFDRVRAQRKALPQRIDRALFITSNSVRTFERKQSGGSKCDFVPPPTMLVSAQVKMPS